MLSCIAKKFNVSLPNGSTVEIDAVIYGRKLLVTDEDDFWVVDDFDYTPPDLDHDLSVQDLEFIEQFIENEVFCNPHNFDPGIIPIGEDPYDLEEVPDEFCAMQTTHNLKRIRF
jgi:hypothetical protein